MISMHVEVALDGLKIDSMIVEADLVRSSMNVVKLGWDFLKILESLKVYFLVHIQT